jgi:phosphoenolpyruvate synthase/pyruvate phosphate dikinase
MGEQELSAWIRPRLAVMRASIEAQPLDPTLVESIRSGLSELGLLLASDPSQTVGVFVRSDTNVEDLDNFNGAGLNLTLFNRRSLDDVLSGLKEVWASPFTYRSFSWRQALIDEPLWVLPSVVILESIATEKSGVLVTTDIDRGDPTAMLIATSEGVGGAVDGSPAETLVWSPRGVELVTVFKSPWRRLLRPEGGSAIVRSTRTDIVLSDDELAELVATAASLRDKLDPVASPNGTARPWDIEYGFAEGKLWLFQIRPFLGNDSLKNIPALAAYDVPRKSLAETVVLDEVIP